MNFLVTGGAGYLGSRVVPKLLVRGHRVRVLDLGPLSLGQLPHKSEIDVLTEDLREVVADERRLKEVFQDCDAVIHLAAVASDGAADRSPDLAQEVNVQATRALAERAKAERARFVFSSSCAVYGSVKGAADEDHPLNPLSIYAETKARAERVLNELSDNMWSAITLRNGTLFGYSPRMRFDLVVNVFALHSTLRNEIKVFGGGRHWRPFLSVDDCARAFVHFSELESPAHRCYNIAHQNLQVADLVGVFTEINPHLIVTTTESESDERDYNVDISRAEREGFSTRIDVRSGAEDLIQAIVAGLVPDPESSYSRVPKWSTEFQDRGGTKG